MRDFTFLIVDPGRADPTVALVNAEDEGQARNLAERWLDLSALRLRVEVHERGEPLFVLKRDAAEV